MSSQTHNLQQLLRLTCDTVADVLDTYREHNARIIDTVRPSILQDVRHLLAKLEDYEKQVLRIDHLTLGAALYPQRNTQILLDDCGLLGKKLQLRIKAGNLRDDNLTRREISALNEAITQLIVKHTEHECYSDPLPTAPDPPISNISRPGYCCSDRANLDAALTSPQRSGSEYTSGPDDDPVESEDLRNKLDSLTRENEDLRRRMEVFEANDQSKLHHIKCLHAAVKGLGMRHPMRHRRNSWEDLTEELPHLIDHIDSTNDLLKDLERGLQPESRSARAHGKSTIRSEPTSPFSRPSLREGALRPPSPTDSNVSSIRDLRPQIRKSNKADQKRSTGVERQGFWNP